MKKTVTIILILLGACSNHVVADSGTLSGVAFLKTLPGARAQSMAGAYTAIIDDPSAVFANPGARVDSRLFAIAIQRRVGHLDHQGHVSWSGMMLRVSPNRATYDRQIGFRLTIPRRNRRLDPAHPFLRQSAPQGGIDQTHGNIVRRVANYFWYNPSFETLDLIVLGQKTALTQPV